MVIMPGGLGYVVLCRAVSLPRSWAPPWPPLMMDSIRCCAILGIMREPPTLRHREQAFAEVVMGMDMALERSRGLER